MYNKLLLLLLLRQEVCLFAPSVTVCCGVCKAHDFVLHAGSSTEMWRFEMWLFSTSTRGWERVNNTTPNGAGPIGHFYHVMTSVGLDLWVHGGLTTDSGEGDTC